MSSLTSKFYKSSTATDTAAATPPSTAAGATPTTGPVDTKQGEQKRMYDCEDLCCSCSMNSHGNIAFLSLPSPCSTEVGGMNLAEGKKEAAADISEGWEDEEWEVSLIVVQSCPAIYCCHHGGTLSHDLEVTLSQLISEYIMFMFNGLYFVSCRTSQQFLDLEN